VRGGAHACLPKSVAADALIRTLRDVADGEVPFPAALAAHLLQDPPENTWITLRERLVLGFVARGQSGPAIADALDVAEGVVRNSLRNVLEKLHGRLQVAH
jgi:two-component system nitrate/nitrite response regulator NarL